MMIHTDERKISLLALQSHELTAEEHASFREHLEECAGCRSLYERIASYYEEVEQILSEDDTGTDRLQLPGRGALIPYAAFVDRTAARPEDRSLVVRAARWMVRHRTVSSVSLAAALVLGALLLLPQRVQPPDLNPAIARPSGEFLVAYNRGGEELWKTHVGPRYDSLVFLETNKKLVEVLDVDGDGRNEVICAFLQVWGEPLANRKKLLTCYNSDGSIRWQRRFQKEIAFGAEVFNDEFHFTSVLGGDFDKDGTPDLFTHVESALHYPSAVLRLNPHDGSIMGEYWHSGYLKYLSRGDLDHDGVEEITAAGQNYLLKRAVLAVFDPREVDGAGPTPSDKTPKGSKPGSEQYYVIFPQTLLQELPGFTDSYIGEVHFKEGGGLDAWLIENMQSPIISIFVFQFDPDMRCMNVTRPDDSKKLINRFKGDDELMRRLQSKEYLEELRRGVRYWDEKKFVSQATLNRRYRQNPNP